MRRIILALISLVALSSCSVLITKNQKERYLRDNCKGEIRDSIREVYSYREKIDTVTIPEDSTFLKMYFDCDKENNVILRQLEEYKGKIFKTDIIYKDKILYVKTNTDEQKILTTNKEVVEEKYKEQKKDIVYEKRYIPKWVWYVWGASLILVWFRKPIFKFIKSLHL